MKINLVDKNGVTLKTAGTYVEEDLEVGLSETDQQALVAENVAEGITILGVTGTHEGRDTTQEDGLVEGTLTTYSNDRVTSVGVNVFYYSTLKEINLPNVTSVGAKAFMYATNLTSIDISNLTEVELQCFWNCYSLTSIVLPNATKLKLNSFEGCRLLTSVDLHKVSIMQSSIFSGCYSLKKVIIRQSDNVCSLTNTNVFNNCYHILGTVNSTYNPNGDKDGYIYVPDELVEDYKSATNWSTYADQIKPLSELVEE